MKLGIVEIPHAGKAPAGPAAVRLRVIGDSNARALFNAHSDMLTKGTWPRDVAPMFCWGSNAVEWHQPLVEISGDTCRIVHPVLQQIFDDDTASERGLSNVVYCFCANSYTVRVWRHQQWTRFAPLRLAKGETPVSDHVLRQIVLEDQKHALDAAIGFARRGARVVLIEGPRPFAGHEAMAANGIRRDVVLHIDGFHRALVAEELARAGIPVVSVPPLCLEADGFMKPEFRVDREGDHIHANAAFGAIMMERVIDLLRTEFPVPEHAAAC